MVLIVKKLVPVYTASDNVPKKYLNLKKAVFVTTFKYPYPNMKEILIKQYGLTPEDKIVIFWTKEAPRRNFPGYRLPFRKVYSGMVCGFRPNAWHQTNQGGTPISAQ